MSDLEGIPYLTGKDDCYGLMRKYFLKEYGLKLSNYARPFDFGRQGIDLISENISREGFENVDVPLPMLEVGDGITFAITGSRIANHIAVYVGNNFVLHHLYKAKSCKENFSNMWKSHVLNVVRHPEVARQNSLRVTPTLDILSLLPPHVRAQFLT